MASPTQSFYSTPAFEIFRRALTTVAVTQFRGMNSFQTQNNVQPNVALDCNNVIISDSGGLEKFRLPVVISPNLNQPSGPQSFWDFQYYAGGITPTRNVVANYFNSLYSLSWQPNGQFTATLIKTDPTLAGPWSMIEANNILFMANNQVMQKWLGTGTLEQWGIFAPGGNYANSNTPGFPPTVAAVAASFNISAAGNAIAIFNGNVNVMPAVLGEFDFLLNTEQAVPLTFAGTTIAAINGNTYQFSAGTITGGHVTFISAALVVPNQNGSGGTLALAGPGALLFGHQWAYAYENSVTGHIGNRSALSTNTGAIGSTSQLLAATAPTDPQVDTIVWYRNLDGGGLMFRIPNPANNGGNWPISEGGLFLTDNFADSYLDTTVQANLINNPPPICRYLCKWQGRIIGANLNGAPQTFFWTGYEQILSGRPEESVPANNMINLSIGAESIAGCGAIMPGVVFWSSTGSMWMLLGALQDITVSTPVLWTDYLEEMPWTMGAYSHNSVCATPGGLVWLAQDKSVNVFNGVSAPTCVSEAIVPLLSRITPGTEQSAVGCYFNWQSRNWYALIVAIDGSASLNKIIFFALEQTSQNIDIFPTDIQADFISVLQTPNGQRMLTISQNGRLYQLPVNSMTTGGVNLNPTETAAELPAYWRSGWFGTDYPYRSKMWRYGVLIADNQGFSVNVRYVDHKERTFRDPEVIQQTLTDEMIELNNRAHLVSIEIDFPKLDIDCSVLELHAGYIGTSDRQS
jgi:hypothetical protein